MHNPGAGVISLEADGNVVGSRSSGVDDVASDRVVVVINGASGAANDGERMAVKMNGVLSDT